VWFSMNMSQTLITFIKRNSMLSYQKFLSISFERMIAPSSLSWIAFSVFLPNASTSAAPSVAHPLFLLGPNSFVIVTSCRSFLNENLLHQINEAGLTKFGSLWKPADDGCSISCYYRSFTFYHPSSKLLA